MSTNRKPAEVLRAAAAKVRKAKAQASQGGPWRNDQMSVRAEDRPIAMAYQCYADAAWIALAHPGLAEPLAAWLEETGRQYEMAPCDMPDGACNGCERRDDFVYAFDVARVILGETTGQATAEVTT